MVTSAPLMALVLAVAGAALAPTLGCVFSLTAQRAARAADTETFAWLTSAILVGSAAGSAAAGVLPNIASGFAAAGGVLLLAAAIWRAERPFRLPGGARRRRPTRA